MLAKIGYGFALAAFGLDSFEEVYVLPSILGTIDDVGRWVGCPQEHLAEPSPYLHVARIGTSGSEVIASIRLFSSSGGPHYRVVVGRPRNEKPRSE